MLKKVGFQKTLKKNKVNFVYIWPGFSRIDFELYKEKNIVLKNQEIPFDKIINYESLDFIEKRDVDHGSL